MSRDEGAAVDGHQRVHPDRTERAQRRASRARLLGLANRLVAALEQPPHVGVALRRRRRARGARGARGPRRRAWGSATRTRTPRWASVSRSAFVFSSWLARTSSGDEIADGVDARVLGASHAGNAGHDVRRAARSSPCARRARSPAPSAHTLSVSLGTSDTTRCGGRGSVTTRPGRRVMRRVIRRRASREPAARRARRRRAGPTRTAHSAQAWSSHGPLPDVDAAEDGGLLVLDEAVEHEQAPALALGVGAAIASLARTRIGAAHVGPIAAARDSRRGRPSGRGGAKRQSPRIGPTS